MIDPAVEKSNAIRSNVGMAVGAVVIVALMSSDNTAAKVLGWGMAASLLVGGVIIAGALK